VLDAISELLDGRRGTTILLNCRQRCSSKDHERFKGACPHPNDEVDVRVFEDARHPVRPNFGKDFKKLFCGNFPHQLRHDGRLHQQKERPDAPLTIEMLKESHEGAVAPELCDLKVPEQLGQAPGRGAVEKPDNDLWLHEVHERRSFLRNSPSNRATCLERG